jgi:PAS domain S-box-containing protein
MAANPFRSDAVDQEPLGVGMATGARVPGVPTEAQVARVSGSARNAPDDECTRRQMDGVVALYRFTDRLYRAGSADDVYASALDAITEGLGCERASILLFDDDGVMRFVAWRGLSDLYRRAVDGHSPWSRDASDPQPIWIDDIDAAELTDDLKETIRAEGIGALTFIPLVASGALAGKFMTYYDRPHPFAQSEIELALTIARQLSFSIERLRAEEARVRAEENVRKDIIARKATERRLNALNDIARMLSSELDLERLVQKITDCATELCGAQFGAFFYNVTNARGESYRLYALSGAPREAFQHFAIPRNTPLFEPTFRGTGVVRSCDIRKDPRYGRTPPHRGMPKGHLPVASYLAVPVISRSGEVHGGLLFGHPEPDVFTKEGEDVVLGIAAHAAIAIDNARLFQAAARLGAIVETSDDAIVGMDLTGVLTSWNGGAERLFGYTAEEAIGRPAAILMPAAPDEELHIIERIKRGERVNPFQTVRRRRDGSLVEVSLNVSPLKDASGNIVGASKIARDITELKQAQTRQELLTHEIQHRTKNLFAVVHAVVARSFAGKETIDEAKSAVLSRLESLAQTHAMLMDKDWHGADLAEIVRAEMSPYPGRVAIDGPSLQLSAKAAQNFAMAMHELATNAAKYGALSNTAGQVHVRWRLDGSTGASVFNFSWQERSGPTVTPPERKGFGTAVLEQIMAECVGQRPEMRFEKEGFAYALRCPLAALAAW